MYLKFCYIIMIMTNESIDKIINFKCPLCEEIKYDKFKSLEKHWIRSHKDKVLKDLFNILNNIKQPPLCSCGCLEQTTFAGFLEGGYRKFYLGHNKKITLIENEKSVKCPCCDLVFINQQAMLNHSKIKHKEISIKELYMKFHNLEKEPLCECGCGNQLIFKDYTNGFGQILNKHQINLNGLNSKPKTREHIDKIIKSKNITLEKKKFKKENPDYVEEKIYFEFKCPECEKSYDNIFALKNHYSTIHKNKTSKDLYDSLNNITESPLCKCGCKEECNFVDLIEGYKEYIHGHSKEITKTKLVENINCIFCNENFINQQAMLQHCRSKHSEFSDKDIYMRYNHLLESPTCECGCGKEVKFRNFVMGFQKYFEWHQIFDNEKMLNANTPEQSAKAGLTLKNGYASGKYVAWHKGLTKENSSGLKIISEKAIKLNKQPEVIERKILLFARLLKEGKIAKREEENSSWKGATKSIKNICREHDNRYINWRIPVLKRDNFTCQHCFNPEEKKLHVHHNVEEFSDILKKIIDKNNLSKKNMQDMTYDAKKEIAIEVYEYHINNNVSGITLCEKCHSKEHSRLSKIKKLNKNLIQI